MKGVFRASGLREEKGAPRAENTRGEVWPLDFLTSIP